MRALFNILMRVAATGFLLAILVAMVRKWWIPAVPELPIVPAMGIAAVALFLLALVAPVTHRFEDDE